MTSKFDAPSRPFAVSSVELQDVEQFCEKNNLPTIARICAELRVLRTEYIHLSTRLGRARSMVQTLESSPQQRFAKDLDSITQKGPDHAPPVA
jgi:hypothetical protein